MLKTDWEDNLPVHNGIRCQTDQHGTCQTGPLWYGTYLVQVYKENDGYLPSSQFMKISMSGTLNVILPDQWKRHKGWQRN
ncbi:MAG: hypothetical protein M1352_02120 [Patescibacteria group bacterium]|nr:hypothetical protein [Patescibacteria group bacterium]